MPRKELEQELRYETLPLSPQPDGAKAFDKNCLMRTLNIARYRHKGLATEKLEKDLQLTRRHAIRYHD